jgi:ABC-2 type transport system permease protein
MFLKILGFEFRYQFKNPVFWVGAIVFFLLAFGLASTPFVQLGSGANVHKNSPLAIVTANGAFVLFYMFITAAFVSNVITRDDETGYGPILRTSRLTKFDYLYGRFTGAFLAAALAYLSITLGLLIGSMMPWVDKETLGPFVFDHYWRAYLIWGVPDVFITSALLFMLSTVTRSMAWTYVGVVALFIGQAALGAVLRKPGMEQIAAVWEPFGGAAFRQATQYWTSSESNTLIPPFTGLLALNRAIWVGFGFLFLALSYALFRFQSPALSGKAKKVQKLASRAAIVDGAKPSTAALDTPFATPSFGAATAFGQFLARARLDFAQVFRSPAYPVLLAMGALLAVLQIVLSTDVSLYGVKVYPLTRVMIETVSGGFTFIALIVAVYYSGELVWREQDRKTHEIIDATPTPDWAFVVPKVTAIALVLISTLLVSVAVCSVMQLVKGFPRIELDKYLFWYVLPQAVGFIEIAALAVFVQSIVPHKFWGWGLMLLYGLSTLVFGALGWEHNLYNYASTNGVPLTDLHSTGIAGEAAWWFRLYWAAIALVLLVLAYGLWRRGTESRLRPRLARLPGRLRGGAGLLLAGGVIAALGLGGFIFYNTDVLNHYENHLDVEKKTADYEKTLLPFENLPQPKITDVMLNVDLHPQTLEATTQGVYVMENRTSQPIRDLHVRFDPDAKVMSLSVEGARPTKTYERFNYRILTFDTPMLPGEKRRLSFQTWIGQKGFKNDSEIRRISANGSFINNEEIAPQLGMDRAGLLQDRATRRKYGLPAELRMAKLEDVGARQFNLLTKSADWVNTDITVTTDAGQTPIAPGYTLSDSTHGDRRTVHFKSDAPVLPFFDIQSGRYAIKRETYKGIDLAIYYDPQHPWNVDRMTQALKLGLDYDQANFSPYQFRQVRIIEFPAPIGNFAQSFANTLAWSEGLGFTMDVRDKSKIDLVTYVAAHELGHQWWAHQVIGANVQGVTMLDETFAQYSAIMAMEHLYGRDQIRRFLKFEQDSYLKARGTDPLPEEPLYRVENQQYIHYRKGSVVMYRLKDQLGEDTVNRALRRLLKDYAFKPAPYPVSTDFLKDLREEAGPDPSKQQIITDLFEKITLYDLKAKAATVKALPGGKWDVTLTVQAGTQPGATGKEYDDGSGKVVERPQLDETVEIGLFAKEPGKAGFGSGDVIQMQRVQLKSGLQTLHFTVDRKPTFAGVDPYNTLIDRNTDDNVVAVGK